MYYRLCLLVLAVGVLAAGAVRTDKLISRKSLPARKDGRLGMYHGSNTTIQKHPYAVSILGQGNIFCVGTIISDSWVVTSADCLVSFEPYDLTVVAASQDGIHGQQFEVVDWVLHPMYDLGYLDDYNYGCANIDGSFKWSRKVHPLKLSTKSPKADTSMMVAGWGNTTYTPPPPGQSRDATSTSTLRHGTMTWFVDSRAKCQQTYFDIGVVWTSRMACAQHPKGTTLCEGDFGAGFVKNGVLYGMFLVAVSTGFCTADALPVLVADIAPAAAWIKSTTGAMYDYE